MLLVCSVILQDHVIKGSCDLSGASPYGVLHSFSIKNIFYDKMDLKGRIHCEIFLSEDFMIYSFRVIS